ncbi:fumarate hydratase [Candidatus Bathyarchaeota archaeon]|nr:fumarate hydratase [Candidatus Bathyarchaeota archaeon]
MTIEKVVEDTAVELLRIAATEYPKEYVKELERLMKETKGEVGRSQMVSVLEDVALARKESWPMCQDTGMVAFMVKLGDEFPLRSSLKEILVNATRRATKEIPLRPNAVDMLKGNTNDNVCDPYVPILYFELVPGKDLELTAMPKGGGSSNVAAHRMLKPGLGMKGVKNFVIEALAAAGSLGCPPYFVGVGVGASEDYCMVLAKKALLKPFKVRNHDPKIAAIEEELFTKVNELGIGAMGLGEGPTALDLHIEMAARHPASLPVGVVISCWALRHAKATISADGKVKIDKSA